MTLRPLRPRSPRSLGRDRSLGILEARARIPPALLVLACLLPGGCGGGGEQGQAQPEGPVQLEDASGRLVSLPRLPRRIVSLVPSGTQTLLALGAGDLLVGRTDYDTAKALASLASVGGGLHPSLERILSLKPDLVVRFAGDSDQATPSRLLDAGIPVFSIRPDRIADVRRTIQQLGTLSGRSRAAALLLDSMDSALDTIRHRVEERPPVRVAYLLGGSPPWVAGGETYIGELLTVAGGVNVFAEMEGLYAPMSLEELLIRDIDLLLAPEGAEMRLPGLRIPLKRVSPLLEIPGPDLAQRARELAELLHPEAFR